MRKVIGMILVLTLVISALLIMPMTVTAEDGANEVTVSELIADLPEVQDATGTEYYFYNQLSNVEKVLYWKMSEATWENPTITVCGLEGYTQETIDYSAQRALAALMADDPEYRMRWERWVFGSLEGDTYRATLNKFQVVSEYHYQKAMARAEQIVATVGMEGDRYSRLRDLLALMCEEMDYDVDLLVRTDLITEYDDSAYGCLLHNMAVCGGFADTVKLLCDKLEIPCITVHVEDSFANHAWNFVQLEDGQWYSVDASMDDKNCFVSGAANSYESDPSDPEYALCIITLSHVIKDFRFPVLAESDYVYEGEYQPTYHTVKNTFEEPQGEFLYQVNHDGTTCTVTGYTGEQSGDLVIPETIDGYTVTKIGKSSLARCDGFTGALIIPDTVEIIEEGAFYKCVGLSGNLTLSQNLREIHAYAFLGCKGLTGSLVIPDSVERLGFGAFIYCEGFTGDLQLPAIAVVEENVFDYCSGFDGTLYLADGFVWDDTIVGDTNFRSVYVEPTNPVYAVQDGVLYSKDCKTLIWCPTGREGSFTVPDGVETIGADAFKTCRKLTGSLRLPASLKTIEEYAFYQSGFTGELILPDSLESIGSMSFFGTHFSGDLVIPDSVTYIGSNAFGCAEMDGTLTISNSLEEIESYAFSGAYFTGDLVIPDSVKRIKEGAFCACHFDGDLVLPDSVEHIETLAFGGRAIDQERMVFTNALDLSDKTVKLDQDAFVYAVFSDFHCNCGAEYVYELVSEAGCDREGQSRVVCSICGGSRWNHIEPLGHDPAEAVFENETATGCDQVVYCGICGAELSREHVEKYLPGDINGDGKVNNKDATRLFQYLSGWDVEVNEDTLDVNGDGKVNNKDATRLFQYLSGWNVEIY